MNVIKKIQICGAVFGMAAACAGEIDWQNWQAYSHDKLAPETALKLTVSNPVPVIGKEKLSGKNLNIPSGGGDLNELLNVTPKEVNKALLVKVVEVPADMTVKLGLGADWWFEVYCNGKISSGTLRAGGNIDYPPAAKDHYVALDLKKGLNVVAIFVQSGSVGKFTFAVEKVSAETPVSRISRRNENEALLTSQLQLRHGPWLIAPDHGTVTIGILTDGYVYGAGVEYRIVGNKLWQRKWDTLGGVLRNDSDLHRITLDNLKPGAEYEYRILLASENEKFVPLDTHTFTAVPDDDREFSFFVTGDTQFGSAKRGRLLKKWQKLTESCDFQVSLGDMSNIYDDFDVVFFGGYLNWQGKKIYHGKPFVSVRGNHELRGTERSRWFGILSADKEKGYHSFTWGKTFFIVLDTGGDPTDIKRNSMTAEATKEYMSAQRQWLKETVDSAEYKNAKFRIILSHEAPHSHRVSPMNDVAKFISEPLLKAAKDKKYPIHLWLSGHIHRYRRTIPLTTAAYANAPCDPEDMSSGADYPFPIITVEGPGKNSPLAASATIVKVTAEAVEVKSFDEEKRCFDHFTISADGKITEKENEYKKETLKIYR